MTTTEPSTFGQKVHMPLSTARRERTRARTALERLDERYATSRAAAIGRLSAAEQEVQRLEQIGDPE